MKSMQTHILKLGVVLMVVFGFCLLTGWLSSAEAVITIRSAEVVNGVAMVEGGNAARSAPISWEGTQVTQANNGGNFSFQGVVPADCVGRLEDGVPADAIDVALANCVPVPPPTSFPAPVPQTGQTQCWDPVISVPGMVIPCDGTGQDGEFQAGVPLPRPRFRDNNDGTVRDNLTGLIWLKDTICLAPQPGKTWPAALVTVDDFNAGVDFSCDDYVAGKFTDWRLPNIKELQSLIHFGFFRPAVSNTAGTARWTEGDPFSGELSGLLVDGYYWSSTTFGETDPGAPGAYAWAVRLFVGGMGFIYKGDPSLVWPVRGPE